MAKKSKTTWWVFGSVVVILLLSFLSIKLGILQSTFGDAESQLKAEYRTIYADGSDEPFNPSECQSIQTSGSGIPAEIKGKNGCYYISRTNSYEKYAYYDSQKFTYESSSANPNYGTSVPSFSGDAITLNFGGYEGGAGINLKLKDAPIGSEVAYIVSASSSVNSQKDSSDQSITCSAAGVQIECNSRNCPDTVIKLIPETLNKGSYIVERNGFAAGKISFNDYAQASVGCNLNTARWGSKNIQGVITVKYIGSKAQFSCDLSGDEVWIQETFQDEFSVNDLEFIPSKFCKETRPFVLRDIQKGETAIKPDPIPDFNRGQSLNPPNDDQVIVVNYATYYVQGVTQKCGVNQANVKINGQWKCQDIIKPLEIVKQCETNDDCPQPLKNSCPSYFKGCQQGSCVYDDSALNSVQCKNEVVTIIKETEIQKEVDTIYVDKTNSFVFPATYPSTSFNFGAEKFTVNVDFTCAVEENDIFKYPEPRADCYKNTVSFMGKTFNARDSEKVEVNDHISFAMRVVGKVDHDKDGEVETKENLGAAYIFTVHDPMELTLEDSSEIEQNAAKEISLGLKNNLPSGNVQIKVTQTIKKTNQIITYEPLAHQISAGDNILKFTVKDTSSLGISNFKIQILYEITVNGKKELMPSDVYSVNYNIVQELSGASAKVEVVSEEPEDESNIIIWIVVVILVILLIGGLAYKLTRRRRK